MVLLLPGPARAATTCSASMTDVVFGVSDPFAGWTDVTATINYQCSTTRLALLAMASVRLCFSIGAGGQGLGSILPRRMTSGAAELSFNLFRDPALTQVWPNTRVGAERVQVDLRYPVPVLGGSGSGSLTVFGRIPSGQITARPGVYSNSFTGVDALMEFRGNEQLLGSPAFPASCTSGGPQSGTSSFPFTATAIVQAACTPNFSVQDLNFGPHGLLSTAIDAVTTVSPQCTNTTSYQIGLDDGQHAIEGGRRMHNGAGQYVTYELYRDSARTQRWGSSPNVDTVVQSGTGGPQPRSIFGRVFPQATPQQGGYSDTVTVTITF